MTDIQNKLQDRGILAQATAAGWKPCTLKRDGNEWIGWSYPVYKTNGTTWDKPRWKSADTSGPRYYWPQGQPQGSRYYFMPGLLTAIQRNDGQVYIAAGEPDVLAYHAAGIDNVFCWFGENSIPPTLMDDLRMMGVKSVVYAPDRDSTGMKAAAKLAALLDSATIPYHMAELPGDMGSKADVNSVWIDCGLDPAALFEAIWTKHVAPSDLALYRLAPAATASHANEDVSDAVKRWYSEWTDTITKALGAPALRSGSRDFWRCPVSGRHQHGDANPSFRISTDQKPDQPWPVCSCDIHNAPDPWGMVAEAVGIESWESFKANKAATERGIDVRSATRPAPVQAEKKDTIIGMGNVYTHLINVILGKEPPNSKPIKFPYQVLHKFGGFAQWTWTGKMVGVGGISGGGKTMLLRVLFLAMIKAGYDMIWWGPEFSPDEYGLQDLIRAGGLSFAQINELMVIRALQHEHGISEAEAIQMSGLAMPGQVARDHSVELLKSLQQQPGQLFVIDDVDKDVNETMALVKDWTHARRAEGHEVGGIGWDYLQLSKLPGKRDWSWGNRVAGAIKDGCAPGAANIVAYVSAQSRKGDAQAVREQGKRLTVSAAQGLDESLFNLWLTLTPGILNDTKQDWAVISVEKNSMGELGQIAVHAKWDRLTILDRENTDVDLKGYFAARADSATEGGAR